ncbi:triacylglycerol lipase [Rhizobium sp. AAP43]|uniref:esterase/lipase family protein n=1 Tax=Rhizobium sp. AAP43 TaxID=1523420 RepID=UPI0006B95F42|nr:alpha/beta hydrolase [Rhizobium sp. AAP43]KPF47262.1 hypothetical protein IP76_00375 [Rhizobium sp. AAP43]
MVEIKRPLKKSFEHVDTHVVFIHGLKGDVEGTWTSGRGGSAEFWPNWLEELPNVATWSVGYPAARVKWGGGAAMAIEDRAPSILHRLLTVPELKQGAIVLVGHSMGGVIIKETLRLAEGRASADPAAASFESRVRKIAFIATPHQGSWMSSVANKAALVIRPTAATSGLGRNDPHLASLNSWFRDYATANSLDVLGFGETQRTFWGQVVHPDSSDLGLPSPSRFIPIDADHFSISAPADRDADVYVHLKEFVQRPRLTDHPRVAQSQKLDEVSDGVQELLRRNVVGPIRGVVNPIIDRNASDRVLRMRRSRYFIGADTKADASQIARDILEGELLDASNATKSNVLAWCARLLSSDDPDEAGRLVEEARRLGTGDEIKIACAFIAAARGDKDGALDLISAISTPLGQTARLMIALNGLSPRDAVLWIKDRGPAFETLDGDGKFITIARLIADCEVDQAVDATSRLALADMEHSPILYHSIGMSHLLAAVPFEMRKVLVEHTPLDWAQFPLWEDAASLEHLRSARENFAALSRAADDLGCDAARQNADDFALWLALRDPAEAVAARERLVRSMADPRDMVHRVPMAMQFGLQLDRTAVDRAINAFEAKGGPDVNDALIARFVLTLQDDDPGALAGYIGANRDKLSSLIGSTAVSSFEIRALAQADRQPEAQAKLTDLRTSGTATEEELQKLDGALAEMRGEDTISAAEEQFRSSAALDDLITLVGRLQERKDWVRLTQYARLLFDRLNDFKSASVYARAAHESRDWSGVVSFFEDYSDFLDRSDHLRQIYAWSLFRLGQLVRAREALAPLLAKRDNPNDRALQINVAITSGDWGSLAPLVERVWNSRADRSALDLLEAGQIGAIFGSPRTRELIREAVAKSPTDAAILVAAYHAAVSNGWEEDEAVGGWLKTAIEASDGGGGAPLQRMSFDDLMNMRPDWERHESETWDQLSRGQMPLFVAAMRLNRTTISMLLTPALASLDEADPRRRSLFLTFSGRAAASIAPNPVLASVVPQASVRGAVDQTRIALEASSLLVLSFLDRLDLVIERFQQTVIPHSTLRWLIREHQRTQFHQPSQVRRARELRDLLSQDAYFIVDVLGRPDPDLTEDVGEELAALLETARTIDEECIQKVVVRPGPVHRPASLMKEDAELAGYSDVLCACGDVVTALLSQGQLTDDEAARARDYLGLHEVQWEQTPAIQPGATLLLDDLAISTMQHLRLIGKLGIAGFKIGIPRGHAERVAALIRHEAYANGTIEHIERIRATLADGIVSGKVIVGPEADDQDEEIAHVAEHPTAGVFGLAPLVDLIVVDDRALNQFANVDTNGKSVSVGCTLDLLDMLERGAAISAAERTESETRLRRAGFQMIPLRLTELLRLVDAAQIQNGQLQETAHLKSIRESIERLRMTDSLQLPADQPWFDSLLMTVREGVRAQWNDGIDDATARARSDWLLRLLHLQGWSHRFDAATDRDTIINRYRLMSWLIMSIPLTNIGESMRRFSAWIEETLIDQMHSYDPASLDALVEQARSYIEAFAEQFDQRRGDDD